MIESSKGKVIWLYGRPCSGKSTLAFTIAEGIKNIGISVITLDGDDLRAGMNSDLGYSLLDRHENIRRASETAKMLSEQGFWVVCSFVTPTIALRELVQKVNKSVELHQIYINASLEVCKKRDVKGYYLKAASEQLANFTGISSPFEEPIGSYNMIETDKLDINKATKKCLDLIFNS